MHFKDKIYEYFVRGNKSVCYEYERYVQEHIEEHKSKRLSHWMLLLKLSLHYRLFNRTTPVVYSVNSKDIISSGSFNSSSSVIQKNQLHNSENKTFDSKKANDKHTLEAKKTSLFYYQNDFNRQTVNQLLSGIIDYDIISFDVFDTAIFRKVEKPIDVFVLMSGEMGLNDFADIRKKAEQFARNIKEKTEGTREITLKDIYDVLEKRFAIEKKWMSREIELELEVSMPNEYIKRVYTRLVELGKTIVFMTDMYLPMDVIKKLLEKNGYVKYDHVFLSNECSKRKGDSSLQLELLRHYPDKRIVHIGDNYDTDIIKSKEVGIDGVYNPDSHFVFKEPELENIAGSIYRAVIQTNMNNGLWDENIYYSHGFRVGGILTAGFCDFINRIVVEKRIDKILFCSRDGFIINKIYKDHYQKVDCDYLKISRFSIFNITSEHYLYDLTNRYIMRYMKMFSNSKTIGMILSECGFDYLIEECKKNNINPYMFPSTVHDDNRLQEFLYNCSGVIYQHNTSQREAAKSYFGELIGDAKNILIVDIGWSGTCITAFKYFVDKNLPNLDVNVLGALLCTSRNENIKNSIQYHEIYSYLNSPFENMDITRHVFPGPPRSRDAKAMDMLHMPFEYLFTSTENSLISYCFNDVGKYDFTYSDKCVFNSNQIEEIQNGIELFVDKYEEYRKNLLIKFEIPPYTAYAPLRESLSHIEYTYSVYKDFIYDAMTPIASSYEAPCFATLFELNKNNILQSTQSDKLKKKNILFVGPEMIYSGAPRSLLRMCRVADSLGYNVTVWSFKDGPFRKEFENDGFKVEIVEENKLKDRRDIISDFDLAICNTVMTSKCAEICCQIIPTVWYIREATNIPDFIRNNNDRAYVIKHSKDICVVSEYAADALKKYAEEEIRIIRNCVEDEAYMAVPYVSGCGEKVKFLQMGTIEYRKGYDVLLAAYRNMPVEYRERSEVYFAGGFIASGASYCDYLFDKMSNVDGCYYLGLISDERKKIETISSMDVVVVASRDESCSLVALEGAMLSRPLIVTENVGAKYIVSDQNGSVVKTNDVDDLSRAMMKMIDEKDNLSSMGEHSRWMYENKAGMKAYTKELKELFELCSQKDSASFEIKKNRNISIFSDEAKNISASKSALSHDELAELNDIAIVSLTSHPGRINVIVSCIESLLNQTVRPKKIVLVLSVLQFQNKEKDLPKELVSLMYVNDYFEILWVDDDLKPHKKYYYTMKLYMDSPIILVDDDVYYDSSLVESMMQCHNRFPDCIIAMRANLMGFKNSKEFMDYEGWIMGYRGMLNDPSTLLVPTGVGGVLYPPKCLPDETFDAKAIKENCLYCDDIWLKIWSSHSKIKTVVPEKYLVEKLIDGSQDVALWHMNVRQGNNNDESLKNTLEYYDSKTHKLDELLCWIKQDKNC